MRPSCMSGGAAKVIPLALILGILLPCLWEARAEDTFRLAIRPFLRAKVENGGNAGVCPVCRGPYPSGKMAPGAERVLTQLLQEKMEALRTFSVVPTEKVEEVVFEFDRKQFEEQLVLSSAELGRKCQAHFVCVGFLYRYEERVGSSIGAEKPASVGLHLHFLRSRDGRWVWTEKFDETQRPLSENILNIGAFLRRKASWLTAKDLASVGMDEILSRLPAPETLEEAK